MTTAKNNTQILAYKGFNKDWTCRGYQYKVGETNVHDGKTKACESGFHACEYPLDVFSYYAPASSVFAVIEASGDIDRKGDDSKITSSKLTVKAEIGIAGLVKAAIEYTASRTKPSKSKKTNNDQERSQASNTGDRSAASNTGNRSAASNTGDRSAASNTGDYSAASNTGFQSAASNTGDYSAASNTGNRSAASNTGFQSAASNTGNRSAASNTGNYSAASNTGFYSAASNTGNRSAASNTGDYSAASVGGKESVAIATGYQSKAMGADSCAIVLVYRNDDGEIVHIRASKVGENGIKPNVWYSLDKNGDFFEAKK